ncbi:MAG TPA: cupredoxin domain-containing protein [Burkholderiales bacterium]|nr:cupredoxin domain-containing protein [Burkholderiales bacterium]
MLPRALLAAAALALVSAAPPAAAQAAVEVKIEKNAFVPERIAVKPGAIVRWTNAERRTTHSILFPAEGLESERLLPGESWERRFDRPGVHPYTCGPHPEMKGVVVVAE